MKIPPNRIEMVYAEDWMFLYLTSICYIKNNINVTQRNLLCTYTCAIEKTCMFNNTNACI